MLTQTWPGSYCAKAVYAGIKAHEGLSQEVLSLLLAAATFTRLLQLHTEASPGIILAFHMCLFVIQCLSFYFYSFIHLFLFVILVGVLH